METLISDFSIVLLIWQLILFASIVLWIYCSINILKNQFERNEKIVWLLAVIFTPIIGSVLYLIMGKNSKVKQIQN